MKTICRTFRNVVGHLGTIENCVGRLGTMSDIYRRRKFVGRLGTLSVI